MIFDKEVTNSMAQFNFYVSDRNFLKQLFEHELFIRSNSINSSVFSLCSGGTDDSVLVGPTCQATSILDTHCNPHRTILDRMYDPCQKFPYLNTVGGLVVNRETDRLDNRNRSFQDDCWSAFTFFLSLFSQMFEPSASLFDNNFACMNCCKGVIGESEKSSHHSVSYKENDLFQLENEEMSCNNVRVNYVNLKRFYDGCNEIDLKLKAKSFTTIIPPPLTERDKGGVFVYVTEISSDLLQ